MGTEPKMTNGDMAFTNIAKMTVKENVPDATGVLGRAIERKLATVLVIGLYPDGMLFSSGTTSDPDKIRDMIKRFSLDLGL